MTKIDIFSGFLGAGKTTLIRKLIAEAYAGEKLVLIENEFGEIAIDGGFLKDAGVEITEMNSGCICCTLVGDFTKALKKVMDDFAPDRILIEPSGVGKLSDVARAVERVDGAVIGSRVTVVDAGKAKMYMRNFGEFFNDQVENADLIVLSRTDIVPAEKVVAASDLLRIPTPGSSAPRCCSSTARRSARPWSTTPCMRRWSACAMSTRTVTTTTRTTSTSITIITTTTTTRTSATIRNANAITTTMTTTTKMSTSITTTTMKTACASAAITTTMTMTSTSITTITTITPTRSSPPGAARPRASTPRTRSARSSRSSITKRSTA